MMRRRGESSGPSSLLAKIVEANKRMGGLDLRPKEE
jgi:hypothetical protein